MKKVIVSSTGEVTYVDIVPEELSEDIPSETVEQKLTRFERVLKEKGIL